MRVLLIRANRNGPDALELSRYGIDSIVSSYLEISPINNRVGGQALLTALGKPGPKWFVLTSTNALDYWFGMVGRDSALKALRGPDISFAAIGNQTKLQLQRLGFREVLVADGFDSESLADMMLKLPPTLVVIPSGSIAMRVLPDRLSAAGFEILSGVVYQTGAVAARPEAAPAVDAGEIDAVLLRSPSAARSFLSFHPKPNLALVCAGKTTAKEVVRLGFDVAATSNDPSPENCAQTIRDLLKGASDAT